MNALRLKLQAEGRTIHNFGAGEPDFGTPEFIVEAGIEALRNGWTRYTAVPGVPELRAAVAQQVGERRGETVTPEEVIITSGAKQAGAEYLQAVLDPGDEVILPAPYWVSYPEMIRVADGIPIVVHTGREQGYAVTCEQLESVITPRTVGMILTTPDNPTGAVYSADQLRDIVALAEQHDLWILSDEIYERFIYEGKFVSPLSGAGRDRTALISGVSKTYAMTGWRIGWAVAKPDVIAGMSRYQGHVASNPAAVSQAAALAAIQAPDESFLDDMVAEYKKRRVRAMELLSKIEGLHFHPPEGAFYLFLDLKDLLGQDGRPATSEQLCQQLLEQAGVALVPGEAFGDPHGARLSYACSMEQLEAGIDAMTQFLER